MDGVRRAPARALVFAAAVLLAAGAVGAAPPEPVEAWVRRNVETWLSRTHHPRQIVDADALAAEAARRKAAGATPAALSSWLGGELGRAENAFAPAGAQHDDATLYSLPFDPVYPRVLIQGPGGRLSHTGVHAFDFVMPLGTPVLAAREGKVAQVVDGFRRGGLDPALTGNHVFVLHADGSFGIYLHLEPGIPVKVGQRVERGDLLGRSGNTGFTAGPHLHFAVARVGPDGLTRTTIPIRFGSPGSPGFVPKVEDFVGSPPRPTLDLAISVEGRSPQADGTVLVRRGDRLRLRVEARPKAGPARDVSAHPRLEVVSMTPWSLDSLGGGEVAIRSMAGFSKESFGAGTNRLAVVGVLFLNAAEGEIGLGNVQFQIERDGATP